MAVSEEYTARLLQLRLECWKAVGQWGTWEGGKPDNPTAEDYFKKFKSFDWNQRQKEADKLLAWLMSPFPQPNQK